MPTTALSGDIRGAIRRDHVIGGVVAKGGGFNATARALATIANENAESWLEAIVDAGNGCDAILVAGLTAFVGFSAAEYLGAKNIGSGMIPITPTAAFPSPFLPPKWMPRLLNRASHNFVNAVLWKAFRDKTNSARAKFKLPPRKAVWTEQTMVYGVSPSLLPKPPDWPDNVHLCGQWLARSPAWAPSRALMEFLAAGDAPVYVGFGSMAGFDSARLLDALIEAMAGRRASVSSRLERHRPEGAPGQLSRHRRYASRLAVPAHRRGHPSRRLGDLALRRTRWRAFHRHPIRRRPVLLGRTLAPGRDRVRPLSMADGPRPRHSPKLSTSLPAPACGTAPERWARLCARRMALRLPSRPSSASFPIDAGSALPGF